MKKKLPAMLTCLLCGVSKPSTKEHWYLEEKPITAACKQCVEERIAAQVSEIQRQVEAGTRRQKHWKDFLDTTKMILDKQNHFVYTDDMDSETQNTL